MKILLSKQSIWIYSLLLSIIIGLILDISAISAEEYAEFDNSSIAANKAELMRTLHSFYVPIIVIGHLIALILFFTKKYRRDTFIDLFSRFVYGFTMVTLFIGVCIALLYGFLYLRNLIF